MGFPSLSTIASYFEHFLPQKASGTFKRNTVLANICQLPKLMPVLPRFKFMKLPEERALTPQEISVILYTKSHVLIRVAD